MAELYMDDFKNKIAAISGGVNPNAAVWGGDDGRRYTDVDMGQTIYMPTEEESMEPASMESPKEAANEPVVDTWGDAHKENALKKYYGHDEATLETVRNITKNNNNVSENLMLSDPEYMKHVQDLELENAKDIDPNTIYKEFPELEKLAKDGKEIEAAIAANNLKDIRMQKSIMQHYQDTLRYEEINSELKFIAQAERYGGKDIDENRVKALQKELKTLDNGSFEEHPLDVIIGGTMQQAGQMLRSTLKGVERGIEGGVMVGTLSAAAGTAVPVVGNVGGAVGGFATGFGLGMRAGYFEGSYNEMVDLNYLQLRMQKNADGTNVYTKSQAAVIAPVQAALSAGIESFNTGAILERIGGAKTIAAKQIKDILTNAETKESAWNALGVFVKDMVKSNLKTTAEESAEEAVQSVSDDLVLNLASLAYDTPTVSVGQIAQNAKENFMEALPVSFGFGLVGNAASLSGGVRKVARAASFNNETKQQLNRIENGNNIVAQLKEHIANSEFFKKSPEVAQEVLHQQLADSGLDTVYIDAQDLVQTDNGRALVEDCLNKLDLSEEQKINILAGKEDFHMPTEVYMQTELSDSQSGKEYITYQASDECFAKHKKYAEIMRQDMVDFLKTEIEQKKEINQAIVENLYEDKNDQALAAKLLQEHGMNKIGQYLNEKIGVLNDSINKILEKYTPERDALEIESGVDYYVPGKGRGYYVDFDGNYVDAADLGSDTKGEQKNWKWTPAVKSIEQPWVQNWKAENKGRLTKAEIQKVVIDAMNGNDKYGIFPDGMLADPETVAEMQKDLATLQEAQTNLATLNKMKEGFAKLDSDENVLAQGLSDEGYKVYRELYEALKNSPSAESREAARYNAILLARHADRFADAMRAAGKENYSAIDYINERLRVDLNAKEVQEGALKQEETNVVAGGKLAYPRPAKELIAAYEELTNMTAKDIDISQFAGLEKKDIRKKARDIFKNIFKVPGTENQYIAVQNKNGDNIEMTMSGFKEMQAHSGIIDVMYIVPYLKEIVENGVFLFESAPNLDRSEKKAKDDNTKSYRYYGYKVNLNGVEQYVKITVKVGYNGNLYYDGDVNVITNNEGVSPRASQPDSNSGASQGNTPLVDNSIAQWMHDVNTLRQMQQNNDVLYQMFDERTKGAIQINKKAPSIISLFKTANQSTFMHETGHMALQDLKELAEMEGAPEQIKKDWDTVKQWLNYKDDQEGFTVKQQEKFARGFEAYLRTGEAPAVGLKRIFRQFKKWLCDIYSDFKQLGGEPSIEVKAVMSRMLCTQEEIDMAARRSDHRRFVRAGGLDFMDTTTAERYQKWQEEAIEEAKEKVMKKAMQDVVEDIAELRKEQEQSIRDAVETEYAENEILAANDLIQSMPEEKKEILAYYNLNEDVYEENLAALGGSREAAVNQKTQEELDKLFYNEAVEENIRAEAEQAIAEGKYNDMLYELETEILQEKQKAEERVGKLADEKLQAIEKELSGIDPNNYTPEKLSALQRKVNDLMYTIRWNQAETDMLLSLQKAIEHAKLEAEILSHKADVKDLKKQLSDLRKSAAADLRQAEKDAKKERDYNKRWAEAETRILLDIEKAKGKEVADDLRHQIKEAKYNARWQAAEQNYMLEAEKAKGQEAVAKEKRKQAEAEYNARWREAELNFVIDEFKGKLKGMTEDFNEYRKSVRTGLRSVRDTEKGGWVKALKEYVGGWGFNFTETLRETTNERYWRNQSTAYSRNSYSEMTKENWEKAAREKRGSIYANIVANQCAKNAKYVDKTITRLQRKAKTLKKRQHMYGEYSYLFNKLMWMYGFSEERPVRPDEYAGVDDTLLAFKGAGFDLNVDPSNVGANGLPNWLVNVDSDQRPDGGYKDNLTILQFKELTDFMLTLYKAGSEIRIRDLEGKRVNAENIAQDIANRMGERIDKLPDAGKKKFHQEKTFWEETIETGKQGLFDLLNIETILDYMGPEAKDFIYNRINDAYAKEMRMQKEVNKQLKTALEFLDKGWLEKDYQIAGETVTGKELLAVALNCGTELGRQRILDSKQMDQNTLNKALSNLTENEWKFVQSVWDIFGGLWPEARAVQVAINGAAPRTEQASAFTITDVNGNVHDIKGGYYPLAYDTAQNIRAAQQQATNAAKGAATNTNMMRNSGTGFMKNRANKVSEQVVLTDLNLLGRALNDQVHFICMRESYLDVSRLVNTEAFKNAVVDHFGVKMWQAINTWTNDQWARATPQLNWIERQMRTARQNSTLAILGWRTGTAVLNVSNITNLMLYLGPQRTMKAIWEYYGNGMLQRRTAIFEKSMFMQERAATIERDVREQLNKEIAIGHLDKADVARKKFIEASFNLITETDLMLALPLWQEEYQRAYKEAGINGKSAEIAEREGIRAGDEAVRKMFGSGLPQDLNVYQKGSEMAKTLTTFYSYFSVIGNAVASGYLQSKVNKKQGMQGVKAWAPFVRSMLYMVLLQSVVDAVVRQGMDMAGGDDWDSEEFAKKSATNVAENLLGFIPGVRDFVPRYIEKKLGERQRDFRIPIFTWFDQFGKTEDALTNPKKDAADFAYEVARFFSLSTGISTTVVDSIPTTLRYLDDVERYDLKDYISSLILDRRLKKDKK